MPAINLHKIKNTVVLLLAVLPLWNACEEEDSQMLAKVGEERLMLPDVLLKMPLKCTGGDSILFVQNYVDQWVNEQLLYQQGLRNVPDLDDLEQQVRQYRRELIARTYQRERLAIYAQEVSEEECEAFYEKNKSQLRLKYPIIQGVYVKVLANSSHVKQVKDWLKEVQNGDLKHSTDFELFCEQRASEYESFMGQWIEMRKLTDRLPVKVGDPARFLQRQVYQMKDADYIYLFLICDFRLEGEVQPFEFCYKDVHEALLQQKNVNFRRQLQQDLRDEALRTGLLILNR